MEGLDFFDGGGLGFHGDGDFGEERERWKMLFFTFFREVGVEFCIIGGERTGYDGVFGLESLDDDGGGIEVATTDAADDLGQEVESAFFGGEIREGEAGVGLDDANRGEIGQIETASEGLGADQDVDVARFDVGIERIEGLIFFVVGVKTGNFGGFEELFELGFE